MFHLHDSLFCIKLHNVKTQNKCFLTSNYINIFQSFLAHFQQDTIMRISLFTSQWNEHGDLISWHIYNDKKDLYLHKNLVSNINPNVSKESIFVKPTTKHKTWNHGSSPLILGFYEATHWAGGTSPNEIHTYKIY